jgi:hypothetical protein
MGIAGARKRSRRAFAPDMSPVGSGARWAEFPLEGLRGIPAPGDPDLAVLARYRAALRGALGSKLNRQCSRTRVVGKTGKSDQQGFRGAGNQRNP